MGGAYHAQDRPGRVALAAAVLMASVFPVTLFPSSPHTHPGADGQWSGIQGEVLLISVPVGEEPSHVMGRFLGRHIPLFPGKAGTYVGLLGIDVQDPPGMHELVVQVQDGESRRRLSFMVLIVEASYPVEHKALIQEHVQLSPAEESQVAGDTKRARSLFRSMTPRRHWRDSFVEPLTGRVIGAFGSRPPDDHGNGPPHNGEDIAAPHGQDVRATNAGVVRMAGSYVFGGRGVLVDHGLGLYTAYFHLSDILVEEGASVTRGQVIGRVGTTGFASEPHVHWSARAGGARINPYSLLALNVPS